MLRRVPAGACVAAALALALPPAPAPAQDVRDLAVRFASISPWAEPGRPLRLSLSIANRAALPVEDLSVRLTFFGRVITRNELRQALDGERDAEVVAVTTEDVGGPIAPGARRTIEVERALPALSTAFRPGQGRSGVYPLDVEIADERGSIGRWHTAVVFLLVPPPARLNVAWIWTVHAPPALDRQGTVDARIAGDWLGPGGIARTIAALAARRNAHATLAPSGALLDALAALASGEARAGPAEPSSPPATPAGAAPGGAEKALADLRSAMGGPMQLALLPYGRADLSALWHAGLRGDVRRQIREGREASVRAFRSGPGGALLVPPGFRLDPDAAREVRALGIRRLVLTGADFPEVDDPTARGLGFGATRPVLVEGADGARFEALLADPGIRARLARQDEDPVLHAQGAVAETAASFLEVPALANGRLIVIAHDRTPAPATARALLSAFSDAPWVRLRTASEAFEAFPPDEEVLRLPRPEPPLERPTNLRIARRARDLVERLREIVIGPAPGVAKLDRMLLAAESADWIGDPRAGRRLASSARARTLDLLRDVRAPDRRVTLTARTGELPVTLVNETGLRVRVLVRLEAVKVSFPRGATRIVELDDRIRTLSFAARARATGSFTVTVHLETPERGRTIGAGEIVVRSTAVSSVTLIATGGGMLVLIAAWLRRDARKRRAGAGAPPKL